MKKQKGPVQPVARPKAHSAPKAQGRRSYQDDPRYKEFYDRLRRANPEPSYEEEPQPMSLDELEERGWDGVLRAPAPHPEPSTQERIKKLEELKRVEQVRQIESVREDEDEFVPGTLMLLDDGSVAIYKDAVSGKDYALFYFLEPDGTIAPRGIFVKQYDAQRIGQLPKELFESMLRTNSWDRDAVVFHLDRYEYANHIRKLMMRTPAGGAFTTRPRPVQRRAPAPVERPEPEAEPESEPAAEPQAPTRPTRLWRDEEEKRPPTQPEPEYEPEPIAPKKDTLERGRIIRINVGGRIWESVCWTQDEISPIVAHNTNGDWALMHLDLSRFRDSIEYGNMLPPENIAEIEHSLAKQSR